MPQKILVIGGGGYIGSMLIPELAKNEYYVRCFDRFTSPEIVSKLKSNKNTEVIIGDVRDIALENFFGIDIVIDLVSLTKNLDEASRLLGLSEKKRVVLKEEIRESPLKNNLNKENKWLH